MKVVGCVLILLGLCGAAMAADVTQVFDRDLKNIETDLVPLAEAMPAEKYDFVPTHGEFSGVRTFGQQVSHVAAVIYLCSASVMGTPVPKEAGEGESGPASLKGKEDIVKYLKAAMAYGHKALTTLTPANMGDMIPSPFGKNKVARVSMATALAWHSFDHYGQMVVYLRMNGIVPPASKR